MKLQEYVEKEVKVSGETKTNVLRKLSEASGVSLLTLQNVARGSMLVRYDKASAIVSATDNKVDLRSIWMVSEEAAEALKKSKKRGAK